MTIKEIKEKYGDKDGYVCCFACPLGGNRDDNNECDCVSNAFYEDLCNRRCEAYERIKKYLDSKVVILYVDWEKKDIIGEREYEETADLSDENFSKWLNLNYSAAEVYDMDGIDRQDVYNKFCESAKKDSKKIRSDYERVEVEL